MAIDKEALRKQLEDYNKKPSLANDMLKFEGQITVRILPYKFQPGNPFIIGHFYYDFGKTILSPVTFNDPDPVVETAEKLMKSDWKTGKKLMPKKRVFVPVIVRGKEDEGVKFWGFGAGIHQELVKYCLNDEYGEIYDPEVGTDLTLNKVAPATGQSYPTISITPKRNISKLSNNKEQVADWLENQKDLLHDVFKAPTYEELNKVFQEFLNREDEVTELEDVEEEKVEDTGVDVNSIMNKFKQKNK